MFEITVALNIAEVLYIPLLLLISVAQHPNSGLDRLTVEVVRQHTITHTTRQSSERVISPSQRPLPTQHIANT